MTKDDITKLPTSETTLVFEKSRFCPSGNKSCWEDYSKLEWHARSLEQQRDAAVMALESCLRSLTTPRGLNPDIAFTVRDADETLAAIKELSK